MGKYVRTYIFETFFERSYYIVRLLQKGIVLLLHNRFQESETSMLVSRTSTERDFWNYVKNKILYNSFWEDVSRRYNDVEIKFVTSKETHICTTTKK